MGDFKSLTLKISAMACDEYIQDYVCSIIKPPFFSESQGRQGACGTICAVSILWVNIFDVTSPKMVLSILFSLLSE